MPHDYRGLFAPWELAIARKLVRDFRATARALQHDEVDDLLQEVLVHWYQARTTHDPHGKASIRTYMARVVRNKLIDLIRERESDKQIVNSLTSPASPVGEAASGGTDEVEGELPESEDLRQHRDIEHSLGLDLTRALAQLTDRQRELCRLLLEEDLTMVEASRRLGVPRGTLYEELKHIRSAFQALGLVGYLR